MAEFDSNKNGTLDQLELKAFCESFANKHGHPGMVEMIDKNFETIYKKFDTNGNRTIEKDEIFRFLQIVTQSEGQTKPS